MRKLIFSIVVFVSILTICINVSFAGEEPKELVEEIFEVMESMEKQVDNEQWANADADIKKLDKMIKELISQVDLKDQGTYSTRVSQMTKGMHKAVLDKEDEALEVPYYTLQKIILHIMGSMNYPSPPVFIFLKDHIEEAIEACEEGDLERVSEEIEEFINMREEIRSAGAEVGVPDEQIISLFMLALDVESASEREDKDLALRHLKRMERIVKSIAG